MRRWLLIAMLLVLPIQMVWAAAAPYCAHETKLVGEKKHFAHHEHQHEGTKAGSGTDDGSDALGATHLDCEACHLGAAATLPCSEVSVGDLPLAVAPHHPFPHYRSHTPPGPERPNIAEASLAARFGGGVASGAFLED
ncbi:MAG: cobalt-zinc-cadmium resistance protein [Burkholderiaceae bacterium]|nr:cobalt-zinc-cadmium resistance protein [Burkholderiaceae bacterium]